MTYRAQTIAEMLGGLYDLATSQHRSVDDLTPEQKATIKKLYFEVDPHAKIEQKFEDMKLHSTRT